MVGAAGLRQPRREQSRHVRAAVRAGADAHLGHLVERVIRRLAEHVGLGLVAELAEEIVHPFHLALDEILPQVLGDRRHVEIERRVAFAVLHRHRLGDARHVGLVAPLRLVFVHERLALGVHPARALLDRKGDALEIELRRAGTHVGEFGVAERRAGAIGEQRSGAGDVAHEARTERDGIGGDDGGPGLDDVELAGAAVDADRAGDAVGAAAHQPGDEQSVDQLHAVALEREPELPGEFEPAAFRIHHAGEIEAAGRAALVGPGLVAAEVHAHFLEVFDPSMGVDQRLPHQHLIGDAVVAGDDLMEDAVDVVARQRDDGPGVGKGGVAGAADQPGIDQCDAGARRAVALGRERGHETACACAHHQHVGVDQHAVELIHSAHHGRGRFLTDGCTSTMCSGQKISQLKQVMQCSRNLMTGSSLVWRKPAISTATGCGSMWITSAGQTKSQMPQPVHFSSSMLSIMPCHSKCRPL